MSQKAEKQNKSKSAIKTIIEKLGLSKSKKSSKSSKKRDLTLIIIVIFLVLSVAIYFRGVFIAAVVNGKPISRLSIVKELEKQAGGQVLDSSISRTLINQEAKKEDITVEKKKIEEEISKIENQLETEGQSLDQVLEFQGLTREDVYQQTKIQLLIEKLLEDDLKVSEEEVSQYIEENKDTLAEDMSEQEARESAREQLKSQKLNSVVPAWLQELQNKANILYFVDY